MMRLFSEGGRADRPRSRERRGLRPWVAVVLGGWLAASALANAGSNARGDDWPQWRGPQGNSVSREQGLPLIFNQRQNLAWKQTLPGEGASTPIIWGDALFVTSQDGDKLLVLRLDARTGAVVWQREVGQAEVERKTERGRQKYHNLHNAASPSPVTDGTSVFVHFGNGDLAAYDFDGNQLWKRNLQEDHGAYTIWWGHANSPVLVGDFVIMACMQDSLVDLGHAPAPSYLAAYHKQSGKLKWLTPRMTEAKAEECDSYTTPVLYESQQGARLVLMGGNQLDAYDPANGKLVWRLPGVRGGRTITGPTIAGDSVFTTQGMRGPLLAVRLQDHAGNDWEGKIEKRAIAWQYESGTPDTCCPVVWDRLVFTVADNGVARCFDAVNGKLNWVQRLKGDYKASPLAAEGRVYFVNQEGLCTVISADAHFHRLAENNIGDRTVASPAVSGGKLFIRGAQGIYAFAE